MKRALGLSLSETLEWFGITLGCDPGPCLRPRRVAQWRGTYYSIKYQGQAAYLHRLALTLLLGRPIADGAVARHLCGHHWCVNPWHLAEGTHADNMADQYGHGTRVAGERHPAARLTEQQVAEVRRLAGTGLSDREIAARFTVSRQCICDIRLGRRRSAIAQITRRT